MTRTPLHLEPVASNSNGLSRVHGLNEDNLQRDGAFEIRPVVAADRFQINPYGPLFKPPRPWSAEIPLSRETLFRHVEDCRAVWQQTVVDYKKSSNSLFRVKDTFPFQEQWDFRARPELLRKLGGELAKAGERLFYFIFEESGDPTLSDIAKILRHETAHRELVLTITSDTFFVPWGMIYTHPDPDNTLASDGSNFRPEGFWGYRHIIEHNTKYIELETGLRPDGAGPLHTSINFDANIDTQLGVKCVSEQQALFEQLQRNKVINRTERRQRDELRRALEGDDFADRILYFYCHGQGASKVDGPSLESANIKLTDGKAITSGDISYWLRTQRELKSRPLVFINACQGGQMTTLFYQTIAAEFLKQKAVGLVGCQIDIPAPFAAEYAKRLLSEFINSSRPKTDKVRLGPLMRDLIRQFIDVYYNPLGLVYSLYRGADCYVDRRRGS